MMNSKFKFALLGLLEPSLRARAKQSMLYRPLQSLASPSLCRDGNGRVGNGNSGRAFKFQGYTLVEILIVLFIIGIVSSVALVSIGRNENRQLESVANEFMQRVSLAQEQAILNSSIIGITFETPSSYQFSNYHAPIGTKKPTWTVINDSVLAKQFLPDGVEFSVQAGGQHAEEESETHRPAIVISANGDITPFKIYIRKSGKNPRYVIKGEADGNITSSVIP